MKRMCIEAMKSSITGAKSIKESSVGAKMSLASQLPNLNETQLKSLADTMLNAGIAFENGGDHKEIFRRARIRHIGLMRRIYTLLEHASRDEIDVMAKKLTDII